MNVYDILVVQALSSAGPGPQASINTMASHQKALVLMVTNCSAEHSFSKLKLLKIASEHP